MKSNSNKSFACWAFASYLISLFYLGNNIRIHNNTVHECPNSGIRVNKGDYIAIENNVVYDNTWWSSSAESAIVLADSRHIDNLDISKMFLVRNRVHGNRNFIPFYNAKHEDPDYDGNLARPDYGTRNQTYIIDGSGKKLTQKLTPILLNVELKVRSIISCTLQFQVSQFKQFQYKMQAV